MELEWLFAFDQGNKRSLTIVNQMECQIMMMMIMMDLVNGEGNEDEFPVQMIPSSHST